MVLEFAANGDLPKLREACKWLKLSELAHVRGKVDIKKGPKTPTSNWNAFTYAVALNKLEVIKYIAETMKCNVRLCLSVGDKTVETLKLAMINHSSGQTPSVFSYLINRHFQIWTMEDIVLVLQDLREIKNKPIVIETLFESASFIKVFEGLSNQDA